MMKFAANVLRPLKKILVISDEISSDKFLGILFGFLQYLSDEKQLSPTDTEYISQLLFAYGASNYHKCIQKC